MPYLNRFTGWVLLCALLLITGAACNGDPTISVSPGSGPAGTQATITISGALPNAPVTLFVGQSSVALTTDASGNLTTTQTMDFPEGPVAIRAVIGNANEQEVSTTFTVTR